MGAYVELFSNFSSSNISFVMWDKLDFNNPFMYPTLIWENFENDSLICLIVKCCLRFQSVLNLCFSLDGLFLQT